MLKLLFINSESFGILSLSLSLFVRVHVCLRVWSAFLLMDSKKKTSYDEFSSYVEIDFNLLLFSKFIDFS